MKNLFVATALVLLASAQVHAQKGEIFSSDSKAIRGYDVVAFFRQGKPVKGKDAFMYQWKEANWYFSSKENLDSFATNPEKYAPQYGGYCAYGCSEGHKAPTDPDTWSVINGKLYFNYNSKVKEMWTKNREERIVAADMKWPEIKDKE